MRPAERTRPGGSGTRGPNRSTAVRRAGRQGVETVSLKAFHIVFVMVSTLLAGGFGAWSIREFRSDGSISTLVIGIFSLFACVALIVYGRWFLRKLKGISYL